MLKLDTEQLVAQLNLKPPTEALVEDIEQGRDHGCAAMESIELPAFEHDKRLRHQPSDLPEEHIAYINDGVSRSTFSKFKKSTASLVELENSLAGNAATFADDDTIGPITATFRRILAYKEVTTPESTEETQMLFSHLKDNPVRAVAFLPEPMGDKEAKRLARLLNSWLSGANWVQSGVNDEGEAFVSFDVVSIIMCVGDFLNTTLSYRDIVSFLAQYVSSYVELILKLDKEAAAARKKAEKEASSAAREIAALKERASELEGCKASEAEALARATALEARVRELEALGSAAQPGMQPQQQKETPAQDRSEGTQELVDALVKTSDDLGRKLDAADEEKQRLLEKIDGLQNELDAAKAQSKAAHALKEKAFEAADAHKEIAASSTGRLCVKDLAHIPATPLEALELAAKAFDDTLLVTGKAYKSAEKFTCGSTAEVWEALRALATYGREVFLDQPEGAVADVESAFHDATGFGISMHESQEVKNSPEFAKLRRVRVHGKKYTCIPHLKGRKRRPTQTLRIHFAIDRELDRIVIGHCGEHLPCPLTRKIGV